MTAPLPFGRIVNRTVSSLSYEMRTGAMEKVIRREQSVVSDERHDLLHRAEEGHEVNEAEESQQDETRKPVSGLRRRRCCGVEIV